MQIIRLIENKTDNFKIKQKLQILYICCVLLPLILTDGILLFIMFREDKAERIHTMDNISTSVSYDLTHTIGEIVSQTNKIYINLRMNDIMDKKYATDLDFVTDYYNLIKNSFFDISFSSNRFRTIFYADNETIVNGGYFFRLSTVKETDWYQHFMETGRDELLYYYYSQDRNFSAIPQRKISFIKKLNYSQNLGCEKLVKYDLDYNSLVQRLINMKYSMDVYICDGDRIIFSNTERYKYTQDFSFLTGKEKIGYEKNMVLYGQPIRILVLNPKVTLMTRIQGNFLLLSFIVVMNTIFPWMFVQIINKSFTSRLRELSHAFNTMEEDLTLIEEVRGRDEIGSLMSNYNSMVLKFREMIKTIYKDRLEKQEIDIARKNAELLALHSQINPHFLFNVLESIRMHSVIRGELQTAAMVERLAMLERQNVTWSSDYVKIAEEISFIEAYLELQKYRFDERLNYEIHLEEDCKEFYLPKLTLVTFVENACVHGVEEKAGPSWVYVRIYRKGEWLYLEVEDTGNGIEEVLVQELMEKIKASSMETLMGSKHVGIINACLRLRLVTEGNVFFNLESEKGVGTFMSIKISINKLCRTLGGV